jgi:type VI protein secretion system component Hcp
MTNLNRVARSEPQPTELSDQQLDQVTGGKGSQSTGAGAGKVSFNPFTITKHVDKASPMLL